MHSDVERQIQNIIDMGAYKYPHIKYKTMYLLIGR